MDNYSTNRLQLIDAIFKLMKTVAFIDGQVDQRTLACLEKILSRWCSGKNYIHFNVLNSKQFNVSNDMELEKIIIESLSVLLLELDKHSFQILREDLHALVKADSQITDKERFALEIIDEYLKFVDVTENTTFEGVSMTIDYAIGILYCFMMCVDGTIAAEEEAMVTDILRKWDDLSARKILHVYNNNVELKQQLLGRTENFDIDFINDAGLMKVKQAIDFLRDNAERNLKMIFIDHLARIAKADYKIHPNERYFWGLIRSEWKDLYQLVAEY